MKFEHTEVWGFEHAIRGMRNPLDSWGKSDSWQSDFTADGKNGFVLGSNDLNLAQRLIKAGSEHAKFLRQIMVSVDIIAPRYIYSEIDTYKIGTVANSCSTMHKLSAYPITADMFSIDDNKTENAYWNMVINHLESLRRKYIETKDFKWFRLLKQELPESFLQRRTVTLNYAVLRNMYNQRKNHKLIEWSVDFVNWVSTLPYAEEMIMIE